MGFNKHEITHRFVIAGNKTSHSLKEYHDLHARFEAKRQLTFTQSLLHLSARDLSYFPRGRRYRYNLQERIERRLRKVLWPWIFYNIRKIYIVRYYCYKMHNPRHSSSRTRRATIIRTDHKVPFAVPDQTLERAYPLTCSQAFLDHVQETCGYPRLPLSNCLSRSSLLI